MTINDLLHSYQDVMPEPADHAELIRLEAPDYRPVATPLNLPDVLRGNNPIPLQPFDVVRVFSRYEVDAPGVTITGEVLRPGDYPLENGMTAAGLLNMAGGFRRSAYRDSADLASYTVQNGQKAVIQYRTVNLVRALQGDRTADVLLLPGDVLSVRQITGWADIGSSVTLKGEVGHPGTYAIENGERLSSVLARAGGLLPTAFPQGAVLARVEVRELGETARLQLIQKIQSQDLTSMVGSGTAQDEQQVLATVRQQQEEALSALKDQPAIVPSVCYEAFGLTLVEAFSAGLPVIGSRLGAIAEIVADGKTGLLFAPGDSEALAERIAWAFDHPDRLHEMRHLARHKYETTYTPAVNYSLLMEIYQQAVSLGPSAK
jgi:protein involved in polysaccharide export with SLBB domain